jgi:hypothetical protein
MKKITIILFTMLTAVFATGQNISIGINMVVEPGTQIYVDANLNINAAEMLIKQDATLIMGNNKSLGVNNGAGLRLEGNESKQATITSTGYFVFIVNDGGTIGASNATFEKMSNGGLNIQPGATIDPISALSHCTFQHGAPGGSLVTIKNNQTFEVHNALFPANTWGGSYNVTKTNDQGEVHFVDASGGFAGTSFENDPFGRVFWGDEMMTHIIEVFAGWSGLSSYIVPANNALEDVFAAFLYNLIIVHNFSGVFWPQEEINTIGNWENHSAFAIKTGNGFTLPVTGYPETNRTFSLDDGWTMLPVICNHNPNTASLFSTVESDLLLVKEIAGTEIYWPAMGINTLPELQLGKAYLVKMQAASVVTFPENMTKSKTVVNLKKPINCELWDNPVPTVNSHIIAIPVGVWASVGFSEGDLVGVFTPEGICAGLAQLSSNTSIAVFGDDPLAHSKQGFEVGEAMVFRIYKTTTGEVFDVEVAFDPAFHSGNFDALGVSVVAGIKTSATSVSGMEKAVPLVYPNPTTGIVNVVGITASSHITIHNSQGKEIPVQMTFTEQIVIDLSANPPGVYLLRITHPSGVFNRKILVY